MHPTSPISPVSPTSLTRSRSRLARQLAGGWAAAMLALAAGAQVPVDASQEAAVLGQRWLDTELSRVQVPGSMPLRMEVSVGSLDDRLRLTPCARVEPYLPVGMRLWGKTRLGLRCLDGATRWNVFLPVTVKAYGPAWVLKSAVSPGAVLTADDAIEAEVDWAAEPAPIVADVAQWVGAVATRALVPGQALRQTMVRPPQAFGAGAQVRVIAQGAGFQVTSDGQAMAAGVVGQPVRIRMENGRIMTGTVLDRGTVRVEI